METKVGNVEHWFECFEENCVVCERISKELALERHAYIEMERVRGYVWGRAGLRRSWCIRYMENRFADYDAADAFIDGHLAGFSDHMYARYMGRPI